MKKEKIEFDLDIFVKELSKFNMNFPAKETPNFRTRMYNVKSNLALSDHNLGKEEKASNFKNFIYWKAYIGSLNKEKFIDLISDRLMDCEFSWNCEEATTTTDCHEYTVVKKTFSKIHKSLKYIPLVSVRDTYPGAAESIIEFSYLYSEKTNLSFLMVYTNYNPSGNTCLFPIKCFKKIKKNEIKQFHSLIFNYYDKYRDFYARTGRAASCNEVLLNNNYKWDLKHVEKFFKKFMKYKEESKKKDINFNPDYKPSPEMQNWLAYYYNIYIYLVKEKQFYKRLYPAVNTRNEIKGMRPF
jgi:hypothetical protein|tara:strand:+ start:527 stop:1420 length:894 start_codon:yes stop_codon:yes gene_type:complete